jgi:hypothetical protein
VGQHTEGDEAVQDGDGQDGVEGCSVDAHDNWSQGRRPRGEVPRR